MIAIIPARGGSKGLPDKNIKNLNGKPMIAYTIEAALNTKNIHRVLVNTDDKKIADIALKYGAEVPFIRPDYLASDTATSLDVYRHAIDYLEKESNRIIENFIVLQPTSPLRTSLHIDEAIELFKSKNATSVISFCEEDHSIFWHKFIDEEKRFESIFSEEFIKNRQDIKTTFYPNGAIYIFNKDVLSTGKYYTKKSYAYIMNKEFSVDIDTQYDFDLARFLLQNQLNE